MPWPFRSVVKAIAGVAFQTPKQGATGVLRAACDPAWGTNDAAPLYVHLGKEARPSAAASDAALAEKLWASSERYCGVAGRELE